MKTIIYLTCIVGIISLVLSNTDDSINKLRNISDECYADPANGADDDAIKHAKEVLKVDIIIYAPHSLCAAKKLSLIKENGDVNKAEVREVISKSVQDQETLDAAVARCSAQENSPEATALNVLRCLREFKPELSHINRQS